ncbi:MAG: hypothetical protein AB7P21_24620 [Lautropia sp.]
MKKKPLVAALALATLAACSGGGGDGSTAVSPSPQASGCQPGLVTGFATKVGDAPIPQVPLLGGGEGAGDGGGGGGAGVGGGEGNGIGGADGQYKKVHVTVELADGKTYGPTLVDDEKGMVTFVGCATQSLPARVTFEGKDAAATYYDEGLGRDVSFFLERRIGLITSLDKNIGVTPLTHALYERAMQIGALQGTSEGWKNPTIVGQAHAELLAVVNDQLPGIYRLNDLKSLPIPLNAGSDVAGAAPLDNNQNGIYGALLAGLSKTGRTNLPSSARPALDVADVLIRDLRDAKFNLTDADGKLLGDAGKLPYTYDTLWTQTAVSAGVTAQARGNGGLQTAAVPLGVVRRKAPAGTVGTVLETGYVLASNGELSATLNPGTAGARVVKPTPGVAYSQVQGFGAGQPVVALRRDGAGVLVFKTEHDGSSFTTIQRPSNGTFVELMDGGSPVVRLSDGKMMRITADATGFVDEPIPPGVVNFTFRPEYAGALGAGNDAALGADPDGAADNGLCVGTTRDGKVKLWRPVFAPGQEVAGLTESVEGIVQVSSDQSITLGLTADGALYHLDANHSVGYTGAGGSPVAAAPDGVTTLRGSETRTLLRPGAAPVQIAASKICWLRAPFAVGCNGKAYRVQYPVYANAAGDVLAAGPVSGIVELPIPTTVWRARANRGESLVFLGTDGKVYNSAGRAVDVPL